MKKILSTIILFILLVFISNSPVLAQEEKNQTTDLHQEESLEAKITSILEEKEIKPEYSDEKQLYQKLELLITKGSLKGETITIENGNLPMTNLQKYKVGDRVIISRSKNLEGNDTFYITDYIRRNSLLWLFLIFIASTVLIGKWRGLSSLLGMAASFLVIFSFILPQILAGRNPTQIAIIGSLFIIPLTFYLSHGFNRKTTVAIIGTLIALIITGVLALFFIFGLNKESLLSHIKVKLIPKAKVRIGMIAMPNFFILLDKL